MFLQPALKQSDRRRENYECPGEWEFGIWAFEEERWAAWLVLVAVRKACMYVNGANFNSQSERRIKPASKINFKSAFNGETGTKWGRDEGKKGSKTTPSRNCFQAKGKFSWCETVVLLISWRKIGWGLIPWAFTPPGACLLILKLSFCWAGNCLYIGHLTCQHSALLCGKCGSSAT